jgi:nucleotide-binding universal stress UspA family protein
VHVWQPALLGGYPYMEAHVDPATLEAEARLQLERALAEVTVPSGVEIEQVVVYGSPAEAILQQSADADLVVVGSRGRGGFTGLLLGSVSQQVAHHARCPVVIVPA